jgi:hypothetical protein
MIVYISEEHREITVPHAKRKKLGPKRQRERERRKKQNTKTLFKNSFNFLVSENVTFGFTKFPACCISNNY